MIKIDQIIMINKVKIQLVKSLIGTRADHRAIIRGLGLRHINSIVALQDTLSIRGMIKKISYLIKFVL